MNRNNFWHFLPLLLTVVDYIALARFQYALSDSIIVIGLVALPILALVMIGDGIYLLKKKEKIIGVINLIAGTLLLIWLVYASIALSKIQTD